MIAISTTRTDRQIQAAVETELEWTPEVNAAGIGVAVNGGVVSLSGEVDTYAERTAANHAALRVRDVTAVVNGVTVHSSSASSVSEDDIGREVDQALKSATTVPDAVKAEIDGHAVTLMGCVNWDFQRRAATRAVQYLEGVATVDNHIVLTPRLPALDTADGIKSAIIRNAQLEGQTIDVAAAGDKVTLSGTVRSWAQRRQADLAAWSSPHVSEVYNHIVVKP
jgi:osmotically-inducible protein OsmY